MSFALSRKWCLRLAVSMGLCGAMPGVGRAADNELVKPATPAAPVASLPTMSAEEMKSAGERATKAADKLGWRLGMQAWTFNKRSFYETIEQVQLLGLHYIEGFPGQKIDADAKVKLDASLSPEMREAVKKKLAAADIKLVSFGVTAIPKDEAGATKLFEFAKEMGIETLVTEADPETLKAVAPLADKFGINIALHDHSKQVKSRYWSPELVLAAVGDLSKRFGSCADVGHWQRSDLDPVGSLKKLEGRIVESHFKDLNARGQQGAHDVVWGTGTGNAAAMLDEMKRQNAKILFAIEYEHYTPGLVQDVAHCVAFFADQCERLTK